jgi:DNA repair exonuclease SbcCD ATPase subunit
MIKEKAKLRDLKLKFHSLQASYEELKTSHENLKETHEKLEEAHNTLLAHENKAKLSMSVGCDLIGEKCRASTFTYLSCSSSDSSCLSNESCDKSLLLENE